jgi:hypothetical protein
MLVSMHWNFPRLDDDMSVVGAPPRRGSIDLAGGALEVQQSGAGSRRGSMELKLMSTDKVQDVRLNTRCKA